MDLGIAGFNKALHCTMHDSPVSKIALYMLQGYNRITLYIRRIWAFYAPNIVVATGEYLRGRGEYFYSRRFAHSGLIFFLCAEIFILWCIVQKYWSGIVTCYTAITIYCLYLTNVSGMLP